MSGVAVIRQLLANSAAVTALVPDERIMAGDLPEGTPRPCISITLVSSSDFKTIKRTTPRLVSERVQVSALFDGARATSPGSGYLGLTMLMKLLPSAVPYTRGDVNGVSVESVEVEDEGPDLFDPAISLYSRSRDFIVRFWEA